MPDAEAASDAVDAGQDTAPEIETQLSLSAEPETGAAETQLGLSAEPETAAVEPEPETTVVEPESATDVDPGPGLLPEAAIIEGYATPGAADAGLVEGVSGDLTWIPFASYMGLWVVLVGLTAYFLWGATVEQPARWMPIYVPLLWSGVGLTALGPVLSLVVWLFARGRRPRAARHGLFASSMTRGALIAFFGVAMWLATLFVLEILAAGGTL